MTAARATPQDFLLFLRTRHPPLARRLDGAAGLEISGRELRIRVAPGSWCEAELAARVDLLARLAADLFGAGAAVVLAPGGGPALPLPVASTKVWNHVAFWARGRRQGVAAVRKPRYLERWAAAPDPFPAEELADPEVLARGYGAPGGLPPGESPEAWCLPEILEDLGALAREGASYAQLVTPFPGDAEADRLEARLLAVKEWGTPRVPAAILQKYVGRLHYLAPDDRSAGRRAAEAARDGLRP